MNERKNCIILFDKKLGSFADKSKEIVRIENDKVARKLNITFTNGKSYSYNKSSVEWLTNPINIDVDDKIIYSQKGRLNNVKEILDFGGWIKIVFANETISSYPRENIKIVRNRINDVDVQNLLEYLKDISDVVDETLDEKSGFIKKQLEKIEVNEESVLSKFLNDSPLIKEDIKGKLIFPLKTNQSQIQAVRNALSYNISAIQGPPGTGKTQTIINIIANLLIRNKNVAVVSGNNEATRNVQEKLANEHLDCIGALLGKRENVEAFFAQQHLLPKFDLDSIQNFDDREFAELEEKALKIYEYRVYCATINHEITEYSAEKIKNDSVYCEKAHYVPNSLKQWRQFSKRYLELAAYLETILSKRRINIFDRLKLRFHYKIRESKLVLENAADCIDYLQNRFYSVKLEELNCAKRQKEIFLEKEDIDQILSDYQQQSMWLLKSHLVDYYAKFSENDFTLDNYRSGFAKFSRRFPVIFSTTHALLSCSGDILYDYVIIDESSQVNMACAVIAMSCAKHIVFVGDLMQLPHIIKNKEKQVVKDVFKNYSLPSYYEYSKNNILQCVTTKYGSLLPNVLLNEHFRCDPQIIEFCNKRFYNGQLHIQTKHEEGCGLVICPAPSNTAEGRENFAQVEIIQKEILSKIDLNNTGIVAPYCDQVSLISKNVDTSKIFVDTVHKFQGKEKNTMILSTVSNKVVFYEDEERCDFLNNENLINVALSRAIKRLYVIASREMMSQKGTLINELVGYAKYYCGLNAIEETEVYSIFELMYNEYSPILNQLQQRLLSVSPYQSENIMATVLQDICKSGKYGNLAFKFNYPLRKIVRSEILSDVGDRQFVENINTHCDFVIYNTIDKSIRLVIEVDGKHHRLKNQQERDERKNRLLNLAGIKILRIKTTDIDCEKKIENALAVF